MAKRVEMIAPFEALRGNVSGKQELLYPTQDNTAWEAPSDKRQYARNYKPRYVISKRSSDGKVFFSLRTKNAVMMSPAMRTQQAILSVSSVCADKIMRNVGILSTLQEYFLASGAPQQGWSFKRWIMYYVRVGLKAKNNFYFNSPGKSTIIVHNPYSQTSVPGMIEITSYPQDLLVKFWNQLALGGITFSVDGLPGIAIAGMTFQELIDSSEVPEILEMSAQEVGENTFIKLGDMWLQHPVDFSYVGNSDGIEAIDYKLTSVAPTA